MNRGHPDGRNGRATGGRYGATRAVRCRRYAGRPTSTHALAQLDIRTAAGHVGGDRHRARLAGAGDDFCLALVLLGVEDIVRMPRRLSMRDSVSETSTVTVPTSTGRPSLCIALHLIDDGVVLLAPGAIDVVVRGRRG